MTNKVVMKILKISEKEIKNLFKIINIQNLIQNPMMICNSRINNFKLRIKMILGMVF